MTASERIRDLAIRHGVYLERYTKQEALELIKTLEAAYSDVLARIEKTDGAWTRQRLNDILIDTRRILKEATGSVEAKLFDDLKLLAEYEAERAYKDFAGSIPIRFETTAPAPEQLWAAIRLNTATQGATLSELTKKWEANSTDRFIQTIRLGVSEGDTVDDLVRRVRGRVIRRATKTSPGVYEGGAIQATTKGAQALVRTAVAHVNNQAREAVYQANEDIIKGYQWVSTLDASTCPVCGSYDGQVWGIDEPRPEAPSHVNCRCIVTVVLKSFRELGLDIDEIPEGTRASMDGQVPEKLLYANWLKGQSKELQNQILGVERANMFRSGTTLTGMVDHGKTLTLAGLKAIESPGQPSGPATRTAKAPKSFEDARSFGQYVEKKNPGIFTDPNLESLRSYTGPRYVELNKALISGKVTPEAQKLIDGTSAFIKSNPVLDDIKVYRGMVLKKAPSVGTEMEFPNFTSFSANLRTAEKYAKNTSNSYVMEFVAPKGSAFSPISPVSAFANEAEVLGNYGQKFVVTGMNKGADGITRLQVSLKED